MRRLPFTVQVFLYRRQGQGEPLFLLLKRSAARKEFWQGVTGGMEPGESPEDAARRETEEETGLRPAHFERLELEYTFAVAEEWKHLYDVDVTEIREFSFVAEAPDSSVRLSAEHTEYRWVRRDDALQLLFWPGNKAALREAAERVSGLPRGERPGR